METTYYHKLADGRVIEGDFEVGEHYKVLNAFMLWFRTVYDKDDGSMALATLFANSDIDMENRFADTAEAKRLANIGLELIKDIDIPRMDIVRKEYNKKVKQNRYE